MTLPPATAGPPTRPAFEDGQVLRAADLRAETAARTAGLVEHQRHAHTPGVVAGLWLEDGRVTPGMAVDALGRSVFVPATTGPQPAGEVWLAGRDADDGYVLLVEPPGRYDPERPDQHPLGAVFLGTAGSEAVEPHAGRMYAGAVGARVAAGSGNTRVSLDPDGPADLRTFAVATPDPAGGFADRLSYDQSDTLRLAARVSAAGHPNDGFAIVQVGHRPAEFSPADVRDPAGLLRRARTAGFETMLTARASSFESNRLTARTACDRLRPLLAGRLNRLLTSAAGLVPFARTAGLRPETARLLLSHTAGLHRADDRQLARLLLEDIFPDELARLPAAVDRPAGVTFVGGGEESKAARPGQVYLTTVADKAGPHAELRIEVRDPGKANSPQRYRFAVGTVANTLTADNGPISVFTPVLSADAGGTVTVDGDLKVFTDDTRAVKGLLLRVKPTAADAGATGAGGAGELSAATDLADFLALVNPNSLTIDDVRAKTVTAVGNTLTFAEGRLSNAGRAPVVGSLFHVSVWPDLPADLNVRPVRRLLLERVTIDPGKSAELVDPKTNARLTVDISTLAAAGATRLAGGRGRRRRRAGQRADGRRHRIRDPEVAVTATVFPQRPAYADRQFLQAADLRADQDYHRQMRWRHNLALHSWGVVSGLTVDRPDDGGELVRVSPGMALDGFGRELVLAQPGEYRLRLDESQSYDVWLEYAVAPAASRRAEERPRVTATPTIARQSPDPSSPPGVAAADRGFTADRPPPADGQPWPVLLGRLDFRQTADGGAWQVDGRERRYAGLVADRVTAPAHDPKDAAPAALLLGPTPDGPDVRFAVAAPPDPTDGRPRPPFLAVRRTDTGAAIDLRAQRVTVAGDLQLRDGSAVTFEPNPVADAKNDPHTAALVGADHWRMYHHFATATDAAGQAAAGFTDELRITMPAAPAGGGRVVVGVFGEQGKFTPVLAVKDDRTVEVYGSLRVKGQLFATQSDADDQRAATSTPPPPAPTANAALATVVAALGGELTFRKVVTDVAGRSAADFADAVSELVPGPLEAVAKGLWQRPAGRAGVGKFATDDGGRMSEFLATLLDDPPDRLSLLVGRTFQLNTEAALGQLGRGFPTGGSGALDLFADKLSKARATALAAAIVRTQPAAAGAVLADADLSKVAASVFAPASGDLPARLMAALVARDRSKPTDDQLGHLALSTALAEGIDGTPATSAVGQFFKFLKDRGDTAKPLRDAIVSLAAGWST